MIKPIIKRTVVLLGLLTFLIPSIALSAQENRIALVIGNGAYKSAPLANPVNDANDMATALKNCNFTVMKSINADRKEMRRAIREFGDEINKGAVGLFYYAGHGIQVDGQNYLVPIGAEVYREDEVKDECLMVSSVLRKMESAGNRLNIIILDACRDNPFGRSFRSSNMGLAKMDAPTGSILAYATAPGSVAADGTGGNGLYTAMLLKHIMEPNLVIERVFKKVRVDVMKESSKRQVPWESSSLTGDFYFNANRGIAVEKRPSAEPKKSVKEKSEYGSISPEVKKPEVVARDRHFVKYDTGVVKDTKTGLEWFAGPDRDTNWNEAKLWVDDLNVAGGGWRMPTKNELKMLYQKGSGIRNMMPLLQTTGWLVWSGETRDSSVALGFSFRAGLDGRFPRNTSHLARSFAVRSQTNRIEADKSPNQVRASHILIKLPAQADKQETAKEMKKIRNIQQKLRDGEDFALLAKKFSEGPSGVKGGDLGFFGRGQMVKPFEDEAFKLNIGEVSDIVRTNFGLHLIKVTDTKY